MTISLWLMFTAYIFAEPCDSVKTTALNDTILQVDDSLFQIEKASLIDTISFSLVDTLPVKKQKRDWKTWRPNPKKALWLAIVIPGAGQIYNRKYWKLPIVYGGFVGCAYAMRWNNMMYKDYSQSYIDLTDDDPNTKSYERFQQFSNRITDANIKRYQELFKNRKNRFRRWRDLSFFVMCGVYALSVIDAYVDAELSDFDISKDLSLKVRPTVIGTGTTNNPLYTASLGVNCSLNF
jgi:hypothetical protein